MTIMKGKQGIIFGISNKRGIAYAIAKSLHEQGAAIAFTYANDIMESRVRPIAEEMGSRCIVECDVTDDQAIESTFKAFKEAYGRCDFVIHAVAFANREDLSGFLHEVSREGWNTALNVSAYSLLPIAKHAKPLMTNGGSIVALTYLGGERYVPNYNIMGVAKAALECNVRYLAAELGPFNIRCNALSAGPVKTLAAKGIAGFDILFKISKLRSPMQRNVTLDEVGGAGLYLASDLSSGVTGETHHVDCGVHCIGTVKNDALLVGVDPNTQ